MLNARSNAGFLICIYGYFSQPSTADNVSPLFLLSKIKNLMTGKLPRNINELLYIIKIKNK